MPQLPVPPLDCFENDFQHHAVEVLKDGKTMRVTSFVTLDADEWECKEDIFDLFMNFADWPLYAKRSGTGAVVFRKSVRLPDIEVEGETVIRHYSEYFVRIPVAYQLQIVQLNFNKLVPAYEGANLSLEFFLAPPSITEIPEIGPYKAKGITALHGSFHITNRSEANDYLVTIIVDVLPVYDFAASIAKDYVFNVGKSMVQGMFSY